MASSNSATGSSSRQKRKPKGDTYHCPITSKDIGQGECQHKCRVADTNRNMCHAKHHCFSPWRICYACVEQGHLNGNDTLVADEQTGLCSFHSTRGTRARREKRQTLAPMMLKTSALDVLARRNGSAKRSEILGECPSYATVAVPQDAILTIECQRIRPMKDQPREYFDQEELERLAGSIAEIGQLDHGIVRRISDDPNHDWELVNGQRRLLACGIAGVTHYCAVERVVADSEEQFLVACVSNFCKAGHTELEEARAIRRLHESGRTYEKVAKLLGRSAFWINQRLSLLRLDLEVQVMMHPSRKKEERLSTPVALFLSRYPEHFQIETAKYVLAHPMRTNSAIAYATKRAKELGLEKIGVRKRGLYADSRLLFRFARRTSSEAARFDDWDEQFLGKILLARPDAQKEILEIKNLLKKNIKMLKSLLARIESGTSISATSV